MMPITTLTKFGQYRYRYFNRFHNRYCSVVDSNILNKWKNSRIKQKNLNVSKIIVFNSKNKKIDYDSKAVLFLNSSL